MSLSSPSLIPTMEQDACGFALLCQVEGVASHALVTRALEALARMEHRGSDSSEADGCGVMVAAPKAFLKAAAARVGFRVEGPFAAGLAFLPRRASRAREAFAQAAQAEGLSVLGWRPVPHDPSVLGSHAAATLPGLELVYVALPPGLPEADGERALYRARRRAEAAWGGSAYLCSLSSHTLVYKGLVHPHDLATFYPDLANPAFASALAVVHQRFSTNTASQWRLAQPFRLLAHNGEINTIGANRAWAACRQQLMRHPALEGLGPVIDPSGSDSMSLDQWLEALVQGGVPLLRALRLLVPPAWQNVPHLDAELRAFHEYTALQGEPWDGPAALVITDGRQALCALDRQGLRPARALRTRDGHLLVASEAGVWPLAPEEVVWKGRIRPGEILAVDLGTGQVREGRAVDRELKTSRPFRAWMRDAHRVLEAGLEAQVLEPTLAPEVLQAARRRFLLTQEAGDQMVLPMADQGAEPVGSMGDDTPLAILSRQLRPLTDHLRQAFAQVTNPPLDPLRESLVMSLYTVFGPERDLLEEGPAQAGRISVCSPLLSFEKFEALCGEGAPFPGVRLDLGFARSRSLRSALKALVARGLEAVQGGAVVLVLSDRDLAPQQLALPALMAVGALHQALLAAGLRGRCNLVADTGTVWDPHTFACLVGAGATAVHPWLAYHLVQEARPGDPGALTRLRKALNRGLLKVLSRLGVATVQSYRGSGRFEALGLDASLTASFLPQAPGRLGGLGFEGLQRELEAAARLAADPGAPLGVGGLIRPRPGGEVHGFSPELVKTLRTALEVGDADAYRAFAHGVNTREPLALRDLMSLRPAPQPGDLATVEPLSSLFRRFEGAAMSLGALSPEAHEAMAVALNRLGIRSNSGEGGEDPARHGGPSASRIKQVASGRFGVTPDYLVNAEVLQIKVAQGAKPGEGGQLPGSKVTPVIAKLRHAKPGTDLISPPPHHDVYSIEDLTQLIHDLRSVNPAALVCVKLVSGPGVGVVAVGAVKAGADQLLISGHDGGTGAAPLTSIRHAGSPWELGLAEAHQALGASGLRGQVWLSVDGGLRTGLDVVKAALLGADGFGFGTAPLVALGCKVLRVCHLNTCPTGVATQDEARRAKGFRGLAEQVAAYFTFVAEEVREWLAALGLRSLEEAVGRTDLLVARPWKGVRGQSLDLSPLLAPAAWTRRHRELRPRSLKPGLEDKLVAALAPALEDGQPKGLPVVLDNTVRSFGARLSGEIARRHGAQGLPEGTIRLLCTGTAGQSLGVWNAPGLDLHLEGEANDGVGKGMAGGRIVVVPPPGAVWGATPVLAGNACLYGATGGSLFLAGQAGERFAVRNAGARAVVEGLGDHGCEYMTGGSVVVLGDVGANFGAGMTGGFALVHDPSDRLLRRHHPEDVELSLLSLEALGPARAFLRAQLRQHLALTGSPRAQSLLAAFSDACPSVWLVKPRGTRLEDLLAALSEAGRDPRVLPQAADEERAG